MVTGPRPGQYFVVRTPGLAGWAIRTVTRSTVNHAGVYLGGGSIIEAQPGGAVITPVSTYPGAVWSTWPLTTEQGSRVADAAHTLEGVPYSWVDVAAIGLAKTLGWKVPETVRRRLNRVDRLMCSQLVDTAYLLAGVHLFDDGRIPGDVSPGDLSDLIDKES